MKTLLVALAFVSGSAASGAPFEFSGYTLAGGTAQMIITDLADQKSSGWIKIGDSFHGYALVAYDAKQETITLKRESEILQLRLKDARVVAGTKATGQETQTAAAPKTYHATKGGDTGAKIAQEHGLTLEELAKLNPEVNWARLRVGQEIRLRADK